MKGPQIWPKAVVAEVVGTVVSRWTAAKAGAVASLWPASPRWLSHYVEEMLSAQSHSILGEAGELCRAAHPHAVPR